MLYLPHIRDSKTAFLDSGAGFQSLSLELGFWISIVSGISNSLSCIPDSKVQDSRFHKQVFLGFRFQNQNFPEFKNPLNRANFVLSRFILMCTSLWNKKGMNHCLLLAGIWLCFVSSFCFFGSLYSFLN